ncbi:hypothetical protein JCGZ_05880 [Jatropha curcas]|uniref:Uncharacterized protein n=1 Tax=Jatropha curcas TaxID=180498 RepID=A0A067J8L6_JATCU|nr:uncharacterized protein LOC105650669 [Jatropha curcas]KDP20111.1 hypothetical protein JCGZ_05880 [Jatropha curcas]
MDQESTENKDTCNRKRVRADDSESNSSKLKLICLESALNSGDLDTNHVDSGKNSENEVASNDSGVNSPEAKRIQDDLLNIFDESDDPMIQGLDSVIRSFEEEILVPSGPNTEVSDVTTYGGGSQPDLGYLLEASDDELGLPPTFSGEEEKVSAVDLDPELSASGATGFGNMAGFEDDIPSYDSFGFGLGGDSDSNSYNVSYNDGGDFVSLGGLFDYADENYVPADISAVQWQPESLSAL